MQTIAHGLSNDDVYVPKIMRWGNCHDNEMYLQMEFVHGKTLKRVKEKDGCVSPEIYDKIRRFIATMRENHIRHGDLHAENILVAEDGQKIYIIDWGLAIHSPQMCRKRNFDSLKHVVRRKSIHLLYKLCNHTCLRQTAM